MAQRLADTPGDIRRAAGLLRAGRLVAFPTETVYGLGADATNDVAVRAIFTAKNRPPGNPLIVHVDGEESAKRWSADWPPEASRLARTFWPGPLTLVLPAGDGLSPTALAGGKTVGLRAPDHPVALELIAACGRPLAAPSANSSGRLSPVRAEHVLEDIGDLIDAVLDGGPCVVGIESTVLDLSNGKPAILRPGMVGRNAIEECLGTEIRRHTEYVPGEDIVRSPGVSFRHYAPRIPLRLVDRDEIAQAPPDVARIFHGECPPGDERPGDAALPVIPHRYAARLYAELWEAQNGKAQAIWLERPPNTPEWAAIHDRLRRASERSG